MDEVTLVRQSYELVRRDFGLKEDIHFEYEEKGFDRLEALLSKEVNFLLDHDLNKLLNILYRIDVPENQVRQLLHYSNQGEIARNIAQVIIEREKQKVITRRKYQP